jgi:hypothetical protein
MKSRRSRSVNFAASAARSLQRDQVMSERGVLHFDGSAGRLEHLNGEVENLITKAARTLPGYLMRLLCHINMDEVFGTDWYPVKS